MRRILNTERAEINRKKSQDFYPDLINGGEETHAELLIGYYLT